MIFFFGDILRNAETAEEDYDFEGEKPSNRRGQHFLIQTAI